MDNWQFKQYDLDSKHIDIVGYIPPKKNNSNDKDNMIGEKKPSMWSELSQEQKDYYNRQRSGFRMKSKIRRSIIKHGMRFMWTLTFKAKYIHDGNGNIKDTGDLNDVWKLWKAFLKRCSRKGLDFPYIVVIEVQEKRLSKYGEKVYHFHFCTSTFIYHSKKVAEENGAVDSSINMLDLWGHGHVFATTFKSDTKQAAAAYLTKYVTKSFEEIEEKGARRYRISKGLNVESTLREETSELEMNQIVADLAAKKKCLWEKGYYCIDGGQTEILVYTIFPFSHKKKKNQLDQNNPKSKKRWKSLEKSVPIKQNSKEEKEKCQSTIKYLQLKAF